MPEISAEIFWGTELKPSGEFVLLQMKEDMRELISKGGIIESSITKKKRFKSVVKAVGSKVNLDEWDFKIGDNVIFNDYDVKYVEEHDTKYIYAITRPQSIMLIYNIEEE